ncbi:MAG: GntR family transcriptional regulator [Lachnospiraceae bacterium]|nr:GntR family transcriptional regulator [Lachnospiraceae bacterium]
MIRVDKRSSVPLYEQIYQCVSNDILNNVCQENDELPSIRELSATLEVSRITVVNAYQELMADGYIYSVRGRGYYVGQMQEGKAERRATPIKKDTLVDFRVSTTAEECFPWNKWRKYINTAFDEMEYSRSMGSSSDSELILKKSLSRYIRAYRGLSVKPAQIFICPNTLTAVERVAKLLQSFTSAIAIADPIAARVRNVFRASNFSVSAFPIRKNFAKDNKELIIQNSSLILPSEIVRGIDVDSELLNDISIWMADKICFLIEYDMGLSNLKSLDADDPIMEHLVSIGSFDEILPAAIPFAYIILPERLLTRYENIFGGYGLSYPIVSLKAISHFSDDGYLFKMIRKVLYHNSLKKKKFYTYAEQNFHGRFRTCTQIFYMEEGIAIHILGVKDQKKFLDKLHENKVYVIGTKENWYNRNFAKDDVIIIKYGDFTDSNLQKFFDVLNLVTDEMA